MGGGEEEVGRDVGEVMVSRHLRDLGIANGEDELRSG